MNSIHSLIETGLDYDDVDVYAYTLALTGLSVEVAYDQASNFTVLFPFMTMAISHQHKTETMSFVWYVNEDKST